MEVRFSRINSRLPVVLPIVVPLSLILIGEALLYVKNLEASVIVHLLNVLVCVMAPLLLKENPIIWQAFSLVSLLRVLNLGMPTFGSMTIYWIPLIYAPIIVVAFLLVRDESMGWRAYLKGMKKFFNLSREVRGWKLYYLPLGAAAALLLANIEFKILSLSIDDLRMVPDLGLGSLAALFIVMVFFVGFGEELVFRYILQGRLMASVGVIGAIIIASIAFAAMHSGYTSLIYMAYVFGVALLLGALYYLTDSLASVSFIHGTLNFFLFSFLPFGYLVLF